jgi:hypothetical protein
MVILRDDGDTRRYFAYAEAMLGRPYDNYFVRPASEAADTASARHETVMPSGPLAPWRDFEVEYPPGVLIVALPPALATDDFRIYHLLFGFEMELLLTLSAALAVTAGDRFGQAFGDRALVLCLVLLAALGVIAARRYDALVSFCLAASVYGLAASRPALSGAGLAAGIVAKGAPALVGPLGALHVWRAGGGAALARALVTGTATLAIAAGAYFWLAGAHGFDALAYHADRPIQIESPYGAALLIAHHFNPALLRVVHSYGSHNIEAAFEPTLRKLSFVLTGAALVAVYGFYIRGLLRIDLATADAERRRLALTLSSATAALLAYIVLGKVFSPQYLTWMLPLGALACSFAGPRSRWLLIAGVAAAQFEYPFLYQTAGPYALPILGAAALIRAGLLIGAAVALIAETYPRRSFGA